MAERIAPTVNHLSRPFWDGAQQGQLRLPVCGGTGRLFWPPSPTSPFASGAPVLWRDVPSEGRLASVVIYRRAFQSALRDRLPYGVALVEIASDARLQAYVADPEDEISSRVGDRVLLGFSPLREGELPVLVVTGAQRTR